MITTIHYMHTNLQYDRFVLRARNEIVSEKALALNDQGP